MLYGDKAQISFSSAASAAVSQAFHTRWRFTQAFHTLDFGIRHQIPGGNPECRPEFVERGASISGFSVSVWHPPATFPEPLVRIPVPV